MSNSFRSLLAVYCSLHLLFSVEKTSAQLRLDTLHWAPPVEIPIFLAGNFAELRSGHFHAGIDIKTQGREGLKICAVEKGYISRIKVAPDGYGLSIYITHPTGYTSVYGHLREFNIQIGRYVRKMQYEKESFAVDLFLNPDEMPVNKGDVIGLSGNTGSSGGPHLHFEIRDTRDARPLNGLFLGYKIADNIPPQMYNLYVYPYGNQSQVKEKSTKLAITLNPVNGKYKPDGPDTINVHGTVGLGIKADDFLNESSNRCGVYRFNLFVNDSLFFDMRFDGFSFAETHYVSSMLDYAEYVQNNVKAYKLYIEPNNKLSVYRSLSKNGLIQIQKGEVKKITIEAIDAKGNKSSMIAYLRGIGRNESEVKIKNGYPWGWQNENALDSLGVKAVFKKETFFDSVNFKFAVDTIIRKGYYSYTYKLNSPLTPLDKAISLNIKYKDIPKTYESKLVIINKINGKEIPLTTHNEDGYAKAESEDLGTFVVTLDTTPPTIKPKLNGVNTNDSTKTNSAKALVFIIEDNLSGIQHYSGSINGDWVLFRYDPKNKLLIYESDEYLKKAGEYKLELKVTDLKGNKAVYTKTYSADAL